MNLQKIKEIVNSGNIYWDKMLLAELSNDPNVIPIMMEILAAEREREQALITDLNLLLSKAHTGLEEPKLNKNGFMQKEIREFYQTKRIGHCFANMDK